VPDPRSTPYILDHGNDGDGARGGGPPTHSPHNIVAGPCGDPPHYTNFDARTYNSLVDASVDPGSLMLAGVIVLSRKYVKLQ